MEIHPSNKNEVAWTSWMPALGYALGASTGPVLEIGIGHFSTPFLHEYCKGAGRDLWSMESDRNWYAEFERFDWLKSNSHHYVHHISYEESNAARSIRDYSDLNPIRSWGVVFIDNSPGGEARARPFKQFLPAADFVVVHDYHRENQAAIQPLLVNCNFRVFCDYDPPTLLASSKKDVI